MLTSFYRNLSQHSFDSKSNQFKMHQLFYKNNTKAPHQKKTKMLNKSKFRTSQNLSFKLTEILYI